MMSLLNGELLIVYNSYYKLLLSGMVHLLGGGVYLMNSIILSMYCKYVFKGLICEIKL